VPIELNFSGSIPSIAYFKDSNLPINSASIPSRPLIVISNFKLEARDAIF
jgi:hypothetical protein